MTEVSMQAFRVDRDIMRVAGADACSYLHGQLSQDVESLEVGASRRSFLLEPTGKTVAWLRLTREAPESFVLDTDAGIGEAMFTRLQRFKLRTVCEMQRLQWECVALRGAGVPAVDDLQGAAELVVDACWPPGAGRGVDLLGPSVALPASATSGTTAQYETLRIAAGVPVTGVDLAPGGIPNEAGPWVMSSSVSFDKGCYTGQELVIRIDSRGGHVPRPLRHVVYDAAACPPRGAEVVATGKAAGRLTSTSPGLAIAAVNRAIEPGTAVHVCWPGGELPARVELLGP